MMTFRFSSADGRMEGEETLTSGMVGQEVRLEFSEEWEGLRRTVVFTAGCESRDVVDPGPVVAIPHEVLAESRNHLYVGVYGVGDNGRVMPSVRVKGPWIHPGIDPAGDETTEPALPVWAQLQQQVTELREKDALYALDDGAGNVVIRCEGNPGVVDDGAGNIILTQSGA